MCVFSTHSIIKHPPFSKLDLISCRNLLIYLDAGMQDRVMRTFHYALKPGGRLFLGSSESVTRTTKLFDVQDKKHRIFRRRESEGASLPSLPDNGVRPGAAPPPETPPRHSDDRLEREARRVMERYSPPHVVIDARDQIVRFSGPTMGRYVELSPGVPSFALFDILRKTLRAPVRAALRAAKASEGPVVHQNVPVRIDGHSRLVTLIAEPMADHGPDAGFIILAFQDSGAGAPVGRAARPDTEGAEASRALEQELSTTRAQLQSTIDELETSNEELKSSNEEHQSVNEELQSSNEEMETAKEEMQSVNEEIQTINAEMVSKNEQLTHVNSDLKNLLESTEIATLFLDSHLRVKSFTLGVTEIFHVRDSDIGRPIAEVVNLLDYAELQRDVRAVLRKLTVVERLLTLHDTQTVFTLRIRPYRTIDNVIDGVVLTFVDVSERQAAAEMIRESEARYRRLFEFIDEGFCTLEKLDTRPGEPSDFRYLSANAGFAKQTGVDGVVGKTIRQAFPDEPQEWFDTYDHVMATGESIRFERDLASHGRTLELFAFCFEDEAIRKLGVIFLDVSLRKRHEEQQVLMLRELDHRVKNLFAIVGGMVTLSARSAATPKDMAVTVHGRLGALASAHQLIRTRASIDKPERERTSLSELVRAVLSPYIDPEKAGEASRVEIDGPEVPVGGDAATNLALVVHELATNAAKYGALSVAGGRVNVSWKLAKGRVAVLWEERGGPVVKARPDREGFGSLLARRSVNGQLGGDLVFHWNPAGLVVNFSAPAERLAV